MGSAGRLVIGNLDRSTYKNLDQVASFFLRRSLTSIPHSFMQSIQQKALYLDGPGGDFVVKAKDIQKPEPGEVLIKICATALNPADWKIQKFNPPFVKEYPYLLGSDVAGTIEVVGEGVTSFTKGDRVCVFCFRFSCLVGHLKLKAVYRRQPGAIVMQLTNSSP